MSNHQPNVWHTAGRGGRHSHSASRTPQNRSSTASPSQALQSTPTQPQNAQAVPAASAASAGSTANIRASAGPNPANVWAQRARAASSAGSNGPPTARNDTPEPSPIPPPAPRNYVPETGASAAGGSATAAAAAATTTTTMVTTATHNLVNTFNAAEIKAFLARGSAPAVYKLSEPGTGTGSGNRSSGGAWGTKANNTANNQSFFVQLAKQVAAFEGGG